jgi:ABC-2 type transport system permease protein
MKQENQNSKSMFHGFWALTNRDLKKWYKEPIILFMSIIQPVLWMGLFGQAMNIGAIFTQNTNLLTIPQPLITQLQLNEFQVTGLNQFFSAIGANFLTDTFGVGNYFSFMAVGMLSFVVVFTAMFSGMSIVWDRRLGFLNKALSTPVPRGAIIMSKVLNSVLRSLIQAGIVVVLAALLGIQFSSSFIGSYGLNLLIAFAALFLLCLGLSSLFLAIAIRSTRWETQMAVVNLLNLPLLFTSNALFPTKFMPSWLQPISNINPITYGTDAVRQMLILSPVNYSQLGMDFAFLGVFALIFAAVGIILSVRYLSR